MEAKFCSRCGAPLPEGAQYCPRCGAVVPAAAVPTAAPAPSTPQPPAVSREPVPHPAAPPVTPRAAPPAAPPRRQSTWLYVVIAFIVLGLLGWALLAGLPFGSRDRRPRAEKAGSSIDVVTEGESRTATTSEIRGPVDAAVEDEEPIVARETAPSKTVTDEVPRGVLSEEESVATLRGYISGRADYGVSRDCLSIVSRGYSNRGYNLEARDRCDDKSLGRWRVDTQTARVYRQKADGRYLSP